MTADRVENLALSPLVTKARRWVADGKKAVPFVRSSRPVSQLALDWSRPPKQVRADMRVVIDAELVRCYERARTQDWFNGAVFVEARKELDVVDANDDLITIWANLVVVRAADALRLRRGPGRGSSVASSLCYALEITHVDPLVHGLDWRSFTRPGDVEPSDIDIDFDGSVGAARQRNGVRAALWAMLPAGCVCRMSTEVSYTELDVEAGRCRADQLGDVSHLATHGSGWLVVDPTRSPGRRLPDLGSWIGVANDGWPQHALTKDQIPSGVIKLDLLSLGSAFDALDRWAPGMSATQYWRAQSVTPDEWSRVGEWLGRPDLRSRVRAADGGVFQLSAAKSSSACDIAEALAPANLDEMATALAVNRSPHFAAGGTLASIESGKALSWDHSELSATLAAGGRHGHIVYQDDIVSVFDTLGVSAGDAQRWRRALKSKEPAKTSEVLGEVDDLLHRLEQTGAISARDANQLYEELVRAQGYLFARPHALAYAKLVAHGLRDRLCRVA